MNTNVVPIIEAGQSTAIIGWLDGSPDDRIISGSERWHTIVFVDKISVPTDELLKLKKWSITARRKNGDSDSGYQTKFIKWFLDQAKKENIKFFLMSFQDKDVAVIQDKIIDNMKLRSYLTKQDKSVLVRLHQKHEVNINEETFGYIVMLAEILATVQYNQVKVKNPYHQLIVVLDYLKGDTKDDFSHGMVLGDFVRLQKIGLVNFRYAPASDTTYGALLADNLAGLFNKGLQKPDSLTGGFLRCLKTLPLGHKIKWSILSGTSWVSWNDTSHHNEPPTKSTRKKLKIATDFNRRDSKGSVL